MPVGWLTQGEGRPEFIRRTVHGNGLQPFHVVVVGIGSLHDRTNCHSAAALEYLDVSHLFMLASYSCDSHGDSHGVLSAS
jgi:hypothetical protein